MTESFRMGPSYKAWEPETVLDFSAQGGFAVAVEMCNGTGACRKKLSGSMCPSYMATLDEEHSTRGRAHALRAVLSGKVPNEDYTGKGLYRILDLCLECKACKVECPSNVDMAKLKYEFLSSYHKVHSMPLGHRLFARIDRLRPLPMFATKSFENWFHGRSATGSGSRGEVILFHDTFNTYNTPAIAMDATRLLESAGYRVILAQRQCCGRPLISKGLLVEARSAAAQNVEWLSAHAKKVTPILGLEPSCLFTLRDEYPDLRRSEEARLMAGDCFLVKDFLLQERERGRLELEFTPIHGPVLLHGHCHQKALTGTDSTVASLRWAGYAVRTWTLVAAAWPGLLDLRGNTSTCPWPSVTNGWHRLSGMPGPQWRSWPTIFRAGNRFNTARAGRRVIRWSFYGGVFPHESIRTR